MPKGGFGNLIALPLQKVPRENGYGVFVDAELHPYHDQWAFLASIHLMASHDIEPTILRATGRAHPLDATFIDEEDWIVPNHVQLDATAGNRFGSRSDERWFSIGLRLLTPAFPP